MSPTGGWFRLLALLLVTVRQQQQHSPRHLTVGKLHWRCPFLRWFIFTTYPTGDYYIRGWASGDALVNGGEMAGLSVGSEPPR